MNRSLPVLTAQACSRRSVSCHLQFLSRCTFFFCRAAFLCPVTSLARKPFFLFFAAAQRAPDRFFCRAQQRPVSSPAARAGLFFLHEDAPLTGHFLPVARSVLFLRPFPLCSHFPRAARAEFLSFWLCMKTCEWRIFYLVNSRGAHADFLGHFCSARALAVHACQGRPYFFFCPATSSSCAQI